MGKHFDIELQVKHLAEEQDNDGIKFAYVSLFFSVEEYDRTITEAQNNTVRRFFEHLKFNDASEPIVDKIGLGQLLKMVNFEDRWVYKGTETFPPCEGLVYWNIPRRIFPIRIDEFARFTKLMEKQKTRFGGVGNNRALQDIVLQEIQYIGAMRVLASATALTTVLAAFY